MLNCVTSSNLINEPAKFSRKEDRIGKTIYSLYDFLQYERGWPVDLYNH